MSEKKEKRTLAIGLMLFALFFGAGNLIFPASMGQNAGENVWWAVLGFIVSGVGLPLAGVLAMGYSGCKNLEELSGRVHPAFGLFFSVVSYLALCVLFATPRTGSVSYEIAIRPFLSDGGNDMIMMAFLAVFFILSYWLAATPQKLVDRIGKILTPALLLVILLLIGKSFITPIGTPVEATSAYATSSLAAVQGFIDGYGTLDAIASLIFAILVIDFVIEDGAQTTQEITKEVFRAGVIAVGCLAFVYIFVAKIGADSVMAIGIQDTGAPVLSMSAMILFGNLGAGILAVIVLLACLSTSIGLISSCAAYYHTLVEKFSYKQWVAIISIVGFGIASFGLKTIITTTIPVLMFLYPPVIAIIILTFLHNMFEGRQCVYAWTVGLTLIPAVISGTQTAGISLGGIDTFFNTMVPLHSVGMGWIAFTISGFVIGMIWKMMVKSTVAADDSSTEKV